MELHWNYNDYQPWTINEQIVKEILVIRDKVDKDDTMDNVSAYQEQLGRGNFGLDWTNYRHWTIRETLDKPCSIYGPQETLTQLVTYCHLLVLRIVVSVTLLDRINIVQKEKGIVSSPFLWFI